MKSFVINLAFVLTALSFNLSANGNLKLAVIEGSTVANNILQGNYQLSLEGLSVVSENSQHNAFETAMNWCVVKIKLNQLQLAEQWCNKAVRAIENDQDYREQLAKYKSLALNNLAIVKYLKDDNVGAYQDFNSALTLYRSRMVKNNQTQFTQLYAANSLK